MPAEITLQTEASTFGAHDGGGERLQEEPGDAHPGLDDGVAEASQKCDSVVNASAVQRLARSSARIDRAWRLSWPSSSEIARRDGTRWSRVRRNAI